MVLWGIKSPGDIVPRGIKSLGSVVVSKNWAMNLWLWFRVYMYLWLQFGYYICDYHSASGRYKNMLEVARCRFV